MKELLIYFHLELCVLLRYLTACLTRKQAQMTIITDAFPWEMFRRCFTKAKI
jgi:hypothetical protein